MAKKLATIEKATIKLNLRQEAFCENYVEADKDFFGNGTECYIEAYDVDLTAKNAYQIAASSASRLLKNVKVIERIQQLLEEMGFNDAFVDKQLSFLITQYADLPTKLNAVKEYNKLKGRIVEKSLNLNVNLPVPIYGGKSVSGHNSNKENIPVKQED